MRVLRFLGVAATIVTAAMAAVAYRRAEETGSSFGAGLREVAGEWSPSAVRQRARLAAADGSLAVAVREEAARQQLAAADAAGR